jgi:hypothetical protein
MDTTQFSSITADNVKLVMEQRCIYYNSQVEVLRSLIDSGGQVGDGVSVEGISKQRSSLLQGLAVDIGGDLSLLARVKIQIYGSKYYMDLLDSYSFYLKDLINVLRLYSSAEVRSNFV